MLLKVYIVCLKVIKNVNIRRTKYFQSINSKYLGILSIKVNLSLKEYKYYPKNWFLYKQQRRKYL